MDSITKALADSERSYISAKAAVGTLRNELLARGPSGGLVQRSDFSKAKEQLTHFRGWPYAAIRPIAQKIAGQAVHVGRATGTLRKSKHAIPDDVQELESHPILDMLSNPNELMVGWSLVFSLVASLELTGRQLWWHPEMDGKRSALPIPTSWLVDFQGATQFETFFIRPPNHAGEPIPIPADEACYFCYPHPGDPHGCISPLQAAGMAVDADEYIQASQRSMFETGIHPKHALIVGRNKGATGGAATPIMRPRLSGSQRRQLIRSVLEVYGGVHKHGEPLILDGLIEDVKRLSSTVLEMDYLSSSKLTKERITQCIGTNPIIMGQVESANRASSLAAEEHFAEFTVNPKIELISQTLTEWLAPMFGGGIRIWIEKVVPSDTEMELQRMKILAQFGAVTVNEMRHWGGLSEVDFGDVPVGQSNSLDEQLSRMVERRLSHLRAPSSNSKNRILTLGG